MNHQLSIRATIAECEVGDAMFPTDLGGHRMWKELRDTKDPSRRLVTPDPKAFQIPRWSKEISYPSQFETITLLEFAAVVATVGDTGVRVFRKTR